VFGKLENVVLRFQEIENALASGSLNPDEMRNYTKERAAIEDIVLAFQTYQKIENEITAAKEMLQENDTEMRAMAKEELDLLTVKHAEAEQRLKVLSLPRDENDDKNVILEVRAGTGGEEAALFAGDLFRMYQRYADTQKWKIEILSTTESQTGGVKEIIGLISGDRVYSRLKFESGVHRVQRVPVTESQGRIHTSACTVAILPEAPDVEVDINPSDLEITVCRASGAGGQHVNTTDSAVRIVHKPSGIAVECQDERSQHKNKDKAMKVLKARLYEQAQQEQASSISADRKSQVGSGDRSERIRTYNFPQGRVTDHRINLTLYKLTEVINGDMTDVIDALAANHQAELLKGEE
jgi:peptide chain release factor 1